MVDVFRGYNSLIQPVRNLNETPLIVKIALQLVLLINVVSLFFFLTVVTKYIFLKKFLAIHYQSFFQNSRVFIIGKKSV